VASHRHPDTGQTYQQHEAPERRCRVGHGDVEPWSPSRRHAREQDQGHCDRSLQQVRIGGHVSPALSASQRLQAGVVCAQGVDRARAGDDGCIRAAQRRDGGQTNHKHHARLAQQSAQHVGGWRFGAPQPLESQGPHVGVVGHQVDHGDDTGANPQHPADVAPTEVTGEIGGLVPAPERVQDEDHRQTEGTALCVPLRGRHRCSPTHQREARAREYRNADDLSHRQHVLSPLGRVQTAQVHYGQDGHRRQGVVHGRVCPQARQLRGVVAEDERGCGERARLQHGNPGPAEQE